MVLAPVKKANSCSKENALSLSTEVNKAAATASLRHRYTSKGGLLVEVAEVATVDRLLNLTFVRGFPIKATIPRTYLQNGEMIKGVPLWLAGVKLRSFLQEGVIASRRLYGPRGKHHKAAQPTARVVLPILPNSECPSKMNF